MMSPILRLEAEISCMLPTACCTTAPPRVASPEADAASWLAICEDEAVCCTVDVNCASEATASCAWLAVCSVRADRSWLPVAISALAVAMLLLASRTCETMAPRLCSMCTRARCRSATSSRPTTSMRCDRSPPAMACAIWRARSRGRQIDTMFSSVSGTTTSTVMTTASTNSHLVWFEVSRWRCTVRCTSWRRCVSSSSRRWPVAVNSAAASVLMRWATAADS